MEDTSKLIKGKMPDEEQWEELIAGITSAWSPKLANVIVRTILDSQTAKKESEKPIQDSLAVLSPRFLPLMILAEGIRQTSDTLNSILPSGDSDSGYLLLRAIIERSVNFVFLTICEDGDFEDWEQYSQQKHFRMMDRNVDAGKVQLSLRRVPPVNLEESPQLKIAVDRFTSKKGRPNTHWTKLSIQKRLEVIADKLNERSVMWLAGAYIGGYDIGAEVQHGTLYGAQHWRENVIPDGEKDDHRQALAVYLGFCLTNVVRRFGTFVGEDDWAEETLEPFVSTFKAFGESIKNTSA